jgi:hypothetical protein
LTSKALICYSINKLSIHKKEDKMKNKFFKSIILALAIFSSINLNAFAGPDIDPGTGATVGGGILALCQPTENKACLFMDIDTITVRVKNAGVTNEYLYNIETCREDWRGSTNCSSNTLTITADNIQVITRGRDEYTFGNDQVYVNLLGRDERVVLNGQMVPHTYHLNIGQGRVGTTDTKFHLAFGDRTLAFGSDTVRRTGIEYFMSNNLPYPKFTTSPIPRPNLIHKMLVNIDARNEPNRQYFTFDIGNIILKVIHENPLALDLGNVNNGKGPAGSTPPTTNPNPNPNQATFEMDADGDRFIFRSTIPATIAQIRAILAGTSATNINNAHIEGEIVAGTQPYNPNWAFHLKETTIAVFTGTEFICDGSAKVINRNLPNIGSAGFFFDRTWCPNTSKLIREVF